jgi:uncharacterized iron-regulated membrane protein
MTFRKVLFWLHLIAGIVAGVIVAVMCFTGAALTFEKEIIAWAERDLRRVPPPTPGKSRWSMDELLARVRETHPEARPSGATVFADPHAAVLVSFGRTNVFWLNPYTGDVNSRSAQGLRAFMNVMLNWHRWLGREGEGRATGKAITGGCTVAFLFLGLSGLYLWWPRQWSRNALRKIAKFNAGLRGKARDWNWHNVIGFWSAPVLIVLTATALPISYRWAGDLIYWMTGTESPATGAGPGGTPPTVEMSPPPPGVKPLSLDALMAVAQKQTPAWEQITLRIGGGGRGGRGGESSSGRQPVSVATKERRAWPLFSTVQWTLDPYTGLVLRKETFADYNLGRKVRSWTRFLHTGEALGLVGQAAAGLASLGALVLVWTGFALAWRRFLGWKLGRGRHRSEPTASATEGPSR